MNQTAKLKKKKGRPHTTAADNDSVKPIFLCALRGIAVGIGVALILLLCSCAIAMSTPDPASLSRPLSYISLLLSALAAGFAGAKINRHNTMLCGIICGALYFAFIHLGYILWNNADAEQTSFLLSFGLRSVVILAAIVGAIMADKKEKKTKKRKRR